MLGRLDLSKWQTGLSKALNFITLPHGPATRRNGFAFINRVATSPNNIFRLIPFVYSASQSVMIEFGDLYVRFHTGNGTVNETPKAVTAITNANPGVFTVAGHGYTNGQWLYVVQSFETMTFAGYPNARYLVVANATANTFTLKSLDGADISTVGFAAYVGGAFVSRLYQLTSPFADSELSSIKYAQDSDVLTLTSQLKGAYELRRLGAANWTFTPVSFAPTLAAPAGVVATATNPTPSNQSTQHYKVTAVAADLVTESLASADANCINNLTIAGNFNTITWSAVGGAARYYVYKQRGGTYGFIGQTTTLSLVDDNILADTTTSPPESNITLNTGANDYPGAVTFFERRRWFAGTLNKPQTIWATRNGTLANLTSSVPSRDDDALEFRIAAQQQNAIRHLVPLSDLLALTTGGEFRVFAADGIAISPSSLSVKPQGFSGASDAQPVLTTGSALYVQAQGSRVRELAYDPSGTGFYRSTDVSLLATHLFNGYQLSDLAYVRAPESTLWALRTKYGISGEVLERKLLGMTYVPDQQVYGWHQHDTQGQILTAAAMPEGPEDVLYVIVNRNGRNSIERLTSRFFTEQEDAFYVDSGLTFRSTSLPASTISGLWHLEGRQVQILADGAVVQGKTVVNGAVTLDTPALVVHVGLGYTSDLVTLPLAYEGAPAAGQGMTKNVSKVYLRVTQTSEFKAGPTFDKLRSYPARMISDPYGSPPSLATREAAMTIDPSWNQDGLVCVRQDLPLPLTIEAMALDTATGG